MFEIIFCITIEHKSLTFDTSEVVVDILMKPGSVHLLAVEVLKMFLKDLVSRLVRLAKVLQDLQGKI